MSWWTDVFLAASALEDIGSSDKPDQYPAVDYINDWLRENDRWDLLPIGPGDNRTPSSCFARSIKNLNREDFVNTVRSAPWQWREQVQLFLREEDDRGFRAIVLWGAPEELET